MIIGLTGGIASGKSTVSQMLERLGAFIIDADKIARQVVEPQQSAWYKLKERFGEQFFLANGQLNRPALAALIFKDTQARNDLNEIMHPEIRHKMSEELAAANRRGEQLIVLDIPLLFESKLEHLADKILVVYVPEQIQKERLMSRDQIEESLALQKMNAQMSIELKKNKGDAYIDNSGSLEQTFSQLQQILNQWTNQPC